MVRLRTTTLPAKDLVRPSTSIAMSSEDATPAVATWAGGNLSVAILSVAISAVAPPTVAVGVTGRSPAVTAWRPSPAGAGPGRRRSAARRAAPQAGSAAPR